MFFENRSKNYEFLSSRTWPIKLISSKNFLFQPMLFQVHPITHISDIRRDTPLSRAQTLTQLKAYFRCTVLEPVFASLNFDQMALSRNEAAPIDIYSNLRICQTVFLRISLFRSLSSPSLLSVSPEYSLFLKLFFFSLFQNLGTRAHTHSFVSESSIFLLLPSIYVECIYLFVSFCGVYVALRSRLLY